MAMSKERIWREAIADHQRSGESVRGFCRNRRLNESSFYYWRKSIRSREVPNEQDAPPVRRGKSPLCDVTTTIVLGAEHIQ